MTFKELLNEVFVDYAQSPYSRDKSIYGIYKNPTSKELKNLIKEEKPISFRVVLDNKKKDVYVFNSALLHDYVIKKVFKDTLTGQSRIGRIYKGLASLDGKIREVYNAEDEEYKEIKKWLKPPMRIT